MKYFNKNTMISFALGLFISVGIVYAASTLRTNINETAVVGDRIGYQWVNAVNTKLGTVDALASGNPVVCVSCNTNNGCTQCINTLTGHQCYSASVGQNWSCYSPTGWSGM